MLWVVIAISSPRSYVGGHYPIDVAAASSGGHRRVGNAGVRSNGRVSELVDRIILKKMPMELFLFLWLFQLAEGFRSSYFVATGLARVARSIW